MMLVRSWPLVIAAAATTKPEANPNPTTAMVKQGLSGLRNVVVALRDVTQAGPRGALAATFEPAGRTYLEALLTESGNKGAVTTIGKRSPTVYPFTMPGFPRQLAAALESLAGAKVGFTVADSDDSLTWAFRSSELPTSAPSTKEAKPPIMRVAADLATLPKLGPLLNAGREDQQFLELLARLRRVDGELVADGDLLRLTLRSPLKQ